MEFSVECNIFWDKLRTKIHEFYENKKFHISNMDKLINYLGLIYVETYINHTPNETYFFKFKIKNKKKFFLRKIEHGF
jgi:hypothetical protein